jgi:uncharacterized protein YlxW (UPF0749 family)
MICNNINGGVKVDMETKQMFELILAKLGSMENKQDSMEKKLGSMENKLGGMENKLGSMENKLASVESKQDVMEKRQDEMYVMQRALEENAKVTRAEQSKMMYILADIQGKVTKLTGEVEQHENFISQIRAIK